MKNIFSNVKGDLFGGLTAGIVALPLALAFGVSSGLGPSAGLYGAIFLGFFAAFFGGTPTQISGPTAPLTAVSMVVIAGIVQANEGDVTRALPAILTVFLLAGILQILIGLSGGGQYIKYIPYPVVSGFMTAIGLIILITQILPVLGYYPQNDQSLIDGMKPLAEERILEKILSDQSKEGVLVLEDFRETINRAEEITPEAITAEATSLAKASASGVTGSIKSIPRALKNINFLEVILALSTVVIIYAFKKITTAIPSTLISLLLVSGAAIALGLNYVPIEKIPSGLPIPRFDIFTNFEFNIISTYVFSAITLAFLGAIDSLLTSVVADNLTKTKHNPNKELVGQGIGNGIAAIFGGLPGAGATIRTVVNIQAGAKTKLSGMTAALLLLIILVALGPLASKIPAAVLAGILITVGFGVMDYRGLKAIPNMQKSEVAIMIIVMLLSTFWNLVYAVGIGLILASIIFMKKIGDLTKADSKVISLKEQVWDDEKLFPEALKDKIFIKHINGPLFFGSSSHFQELAAQVPKEASYVIFRMGRVPYADQSGLYALEEILLDLEKRNIHPLLVGVQRQPLYLMQSINIVPGLIPEDHLFATFNDCMKWLGQNGLTKIKQGI